MRERITIAVIGVFCILTIAAWIYTRFDTPVEERKTTSPSVVNAGYGDYSEEEKEEAYDKGYDEGYEEGYEAGLEDGWKDVFDNPGDYDVYMNDIISAAYKEGYNDCLNGVESQW